MTFDRCSRLLLRLGASVGATVLVSCATPPPDRAGASEPPPPAPERPAAPVAAPPPVAELPPPVQAAPLSPDEVQRALGAALDFLQEGQEDQAVLELNRVLASDPSHRLAQNLMRQIKDDPVTVLGRESFPHRVLPGESLSRIAQRFMNDLHLFYILARYNGIKVPRNLAAGQVIRVPGRTPPAVAATPPAAAVNPAPAAATAPAVTPAPAPPAPTAASTEAETAARLARQRSEAIARHSRAARAAFARQDLDAAIRSWDAVLEIEPDNRTAQLEKQKVQGLKERLGKLK